MAGQYHEFLAGIKQHGVAKTSHFRIEIPLSATGASAGRFSGINQLMGFRCEATELPGRQLVSNDSRTYGPTYKTPYQSLYQEITLNFLETSTLLIRDFFETWMSNIFNPSDNTLYYPTYYRCDASLRQYDVSDGSRPKSVKEPETPQASLKTIAIWKMFNAFPTAVNQMPVAWSEDGLHRTTVTLAFEWYVLLTGDSAAGPADSKADRESTPVAPKGSAVS